MIRTPRKQQFRFIHAALILLAGLTAIYIPLRIYIARSGSEVIEEGTTLSIFATGELYGYREPCG